MMSFKNLIPFISLAALVVSGCKDCTTTATAPADSDVTPGCALKCSTSTWAVVIGMENSSFAGSCPGAECDARRMSELLLRYTPNVKLLMNGDATKKNVRDAMLLAAQNSDLFVFFYSGHGGQNRFADTGSDESDGKDEFLCLHDTYMRDNEIWEIFCKARGRVFMINDCCHSQTMYRNAKPISLRASCPLAASHSASGGVDLLVWSGCPDDTYSYGGKSGGEFTNAILRHYDPRKTYDALWNDIESDNTLKRFEAVQRTSFSRSFIALPVFR